ncbi:GmrSD restriction endonuclease domain-containing protein [Flavobacterium terrisoli]|uniref:GmrSD restriction endonuclease domain-containing protein n=1 Tax=Flavobacterium terrisoli TaxID=3242195 RepID=UPI0025433C1D|nr:DUF262 domain-containing protein [Flavobacterium buctense]
MEIKEIFEHKIKIEPKVMSIESLFNNEERVAKTDYQPFYQRNYVWDDEKATYFIESILLGTEIPPLIYFRNGTNIEVIDGRQRYQTILRFVSDDLRLKKNGLQKLDNVGIANKFFKDLDRQLQDLFWDTKLRIIEFSFHSQENIDSEMEDVVKQEIFKRYNSGITPLKPTEIDNAVYFEDDLNSYLKRKLLNDKILFRNVTNILHFDKPNNEIILKKIRQLLVQHKIPIKYYAVKKDTIISKFYEVLFSDINEEEIEAIFSSFIEKINLLLKVKERFPDKGISYNRLISECLFWSFSILEAEDFSLEVITPSVIEELGVYILGNIEFFEITRSSFAKELYKRYEITSTFFRNKFGIDFNIYLQYNQDFKQRNQDLSADDEERVSFDELRINKPEPSSIAITDICRQMERHRFLIRPPYQRNEVINKKKSSLIIESILLGIKLPPIFVFKREDGISEVLDGQQRLLSILGFIEKPYLDEKNQIKRSSKNGFALNLKSSILKDLQGKKFTQLSPEQRETITNFDLWFIEINYVNNKNFEPIDLFIRLNNKPYPIKEDTFEMWNSYVSRDIISTIKSIYTNHSGWFYIRKNNSRMENENIYTALAYFQYTWNLSEKSNSFTPKDVDIYKVLNKINLRVKSKNEITKVLEDSSLKLKFIDAANDLEFNFIRKLKLLLSDTNDYSLTSLNKNLDEIFNVENGRRTQQAFYALWYFLYDISPSMIEQKKLHIRKDLKSLFKDMTGIESKEIFDKNVLAFKEKFKIEPNLFDYETATITTNLALLGEIATVSPGITVTEKTSLSNTLTDGFPYLQGGEFYNFEINKNEIAYLTDNAQFSSKDLFNSKNKILVKRLTHSDSKLSIAFYDGKLAFSTSFIGILVNRFSFDPKYVLCILGSRYVYSTINRAIDKSVNTVRSLTVTELKSIPIPSITLNQQQPFIRLSSYLLSSEIDLQTSIFFERLIDAMVYELFYPSILKTHTAEVLQYVQDIEELDALDQERNKKIIERHYKFLSDPKHAISSALLRLLNINEVRQIEGRR